MRSKLTPKLRSAPVRNTRTLPLILVTLLAAVFAGRQALAQQPKAGGKKPASSGEKFFEAKVRPLLIRHCLECHGSKKQKGGLRLDSLAGVLKGGENGAVVVRGKPEKSTLVGAVRYEDLEMPPKGKLKDNEIAVLVQWVAMGTPWPSRLAKIRGAESKDGGITEKDRQFWSFQPLPAHVAVPQNDDNWIVNDIDRFVLRKLQQAKLRPSPPAQRRDLIRRLSLNLNGLPPSYDRTSRFVKDGRKDAAARLIDELLESPQYGERWGRHWLDLVRYAESDGFKQDAFRPQAWRYRDYVVDSLNRDKPYDQFVREQLAGDQLDPDDPTMSVAIMYLRHGIYEYNQRDVRSQRQNILNELTDVTADVFLGMGLSCARCHDHKFDPLLQKDYYRLQAFFEPVEPRDVPLASPKQVAEYRRKLQQWQARTASLRMEIDKLEWPFIRNARNASIDKFPKDIRPMLRKEATQRSPLEQQLAALALRQVDVAIAGAKIDQKIKGDKRKRWLELKKTLSKHDKNKPKPLPMVYSVRDVGAAAPPTRIPGSDDSIAPGFLSVLDATPAAIRPAHGSTGRRLALANWIASDDNPLTARVIVNRVWQYHFGRGLVTTSSDFGRLGETPSHPQLLDYLARWFIRHEWSLKKLHRLILNSATYQQSASGSNAAALRRDPENRLLWRFSPQRLDAEQIRDAILAASGELQTKRGGPSADTTSRRRSIYTKVVRNQRDALIASFDGADPFISTSQRVNTTTPNQALLMINGGWSMQRAIAMAKRARSTGSARSDWIQAAYRAAFGRSANPRELRSAEQFLEQQARDAEPVALAGKLLGHGGAVAVRKSRELLMLKDNPTLPSGDFTIEAIVQLKSMFKSAEVRTIVSQWNNQQAQPGWSFGVTSAKSRYQPLNLILQLVGDPKRGGKGYEVVASNLRLQLNKPYYVAVSVRIGDTTQNGVKFFMKDLSADSPLQVARVAHRVDGKHRSHAPLVIGGRATSKRHRWDGLVGEVRLSAEALQQTELLVANSARSPSKLVAWWRFEDEKRLLHDASPRGNNLQTAAGTQDREGIALTDFCHVLLNSNEFLYVD